MNAVRRHAWQITLTLIACVVGPIVGGGILPPRVPDEVAPALAGLFGAALGFTGMIVGGYLDRRRE